MKAQPLLGFYVFVPPRTAVHQDVFLDPATSSLFISNFPDVITDRQDALPDLAISHYYIVTLFSKFYF
jgi:hypothetical protein